MMPILRPYQAEARDRILVELEKVLATLLVLATGLGKTIVFSAVARVLVGRGRRVLVLAHRSELLEQAAGTLRRFGLTVGIERAEQRVDVDQLPDVVIASVQTLQRKRLARYAPDAFGLIVIDECHHAPARSYRAVLEHFTGVPVLGVTATPDRTDELALGNVFASVAFRMELGEGIAGAWLAPIELRSVVVEDLDLSKVHVERGDFVAAELERALVDEEVLHAIAAPLAELAAGRKTLAFVVGVKQAHQLAEVLSGYGVRAAAVDGRMARDQRAKVLEDYRAGDVDVVCNAMLLTEGFDCPETSCIALVRPTRSRSLVTQMIGRGTRLAEGKTSCLVIDFVPERAGAVRLAAPADALAGRELPTELAERVGRLSAAGAGELGALLEQGQAELAAEAEAARVRQRALEAARREHIRLKVAYVAPHIDVQQLLEAVDADLDVEDDGRVASTRQLEALRRAGFEVGERLSARAADALFEVLTKRRAAGLCSMKQARVLRRYGLRDDLSFDLAREALDTLARHKWRPPGWLYRDERFAVKQEDVA